jgi:hypothetical protein
VLGCNDIRTFDSKVKPFFIMIIFDKFDELMIRHDVFHYYFQKYIYRSKRVLKTPGRHGEPKKLIGDQFNIFPMLSIRPPRHFWCKERKSSNPTCFGCWIQTVG